MEKEDVRLPIRSRRKEQVERLRRRSEEARHSPPTSRDFLLDVGMPSTPHTPRCREPSDLTQSYERRDSSRPPRDSSSLTRSRQAQSPVPKAVSSGQTFVPSQRRAPEQLGAPTLPLSTAFNHQLPRTTAVQPVVALYAPLQFQFRSWVLLPCNLPTGSWQLPFALYG